MLGKGKSLSFVRYQVTDDPNLSIYLTLIEEIKRRYKVAGEFYNNTLHAGYDITSIEVMALQMRFMLELVALASLSANKEIFEENSVKFQKHWHPAEILSDIKRMNPNFYPTPLIESTTLETGERHLLKFEDDFLTAEDLISIHGQCGNLLHARNPFRKPVDHHEFKGQFANWAVKIMNLLNVHKIQLLDDETFYLVHCNGAKDGAARAYKFQLVNA